MLILSLIFLLLSNSITLKRDKSILYSRATITILIIATLITYDNLNFLSLNKSIGIFGGLFSATYTTTVCHICILLIISIILLTSVYPRKVWLKENSSLDELFFSKWIYYQTTIPGMVNVQFYSCSHNTSILKMLEIWFLSNAIEKFLVSSKAKHIFIVYLIYALFSWLIGTVFSALISLELSGPGVQFIADNQLYNSIITAHAIIMIFFIMIGVIIVTFYLSIKDIKKNSRISVIFTIFLTLGIILYLELNFIYSMLIISVITTVIFIIPLIFDNLGFNSYNEYLSYLGPIFYMLLYCLTDNESIYSFITNNGLTYGHVLLIYTGIAMVVLNTFIIEKVVMSPLNKLRNLYKVFKQNPNPFFWIGLVVVYIIILQVICNIIGLFIVRDNYTLFYITIMCRIIFIKVAISFILVLLTNNTKFWYSTISMNSLTPIFILFTTSLYYFYILPTIYKMYFTLSNLKYAVGWYIGEVTDKFKDLDIKPLKVMCLKIVGSLLYPLGKISKYNISNNLNQLAKELLTENISKELKSESESESEAELESQSAKQLASKRFLPVSYKRIKIINPEYVHLINNVKHYNFTKTIPRVILKSNLPVISINNSSSNVLFVKGYLENFIKMLNYDKLSAYINIFNSNNNKISLNFEDFTVNLKLSDNNNNNNRLVDINIIKSNGKDFTPKDYSFDINEYIKEITKFSYLQKLNNIVENSIKDNKVYASHGFNYDNNMLNSNPASNIYMLYNTSPNYPSINISTYNSYTYITFDEIFLQDDINKWAYLKEVLRMTSEALKSNSSNIDLATFNNEKVIINDPNNNNNAGLLLGLLNDALMNLNIQSILGDYPVFTEEFLNKLDQLDNTARHLNITSQYLPQTLQYPYQEYPDFTSQSSAQTEQSLYQGYPQTEQSLYQGYPQTEQSPFYQGYSDLTDQSSPQTVQSSYQGYSDLTDQSSPQTAQSPYQGNPNLTDQSLPQTVQSPIFQPYPQRAESTFFQRYPGFVGKSLSKTVQGESSGQSLPLTVQGESSNIGVGSSAYTAGPSDIRPTQDSVDKSSTSIHGFDRNDLNSLEAVLKSKFDREHANRMNTKASNKTINLGDIGLTISAYGEMREDKRKTDDYLLNVLLRLFKEHRSIFLSPARTPVKSFALTDVNILREWLRNPT